MNNHSFISLQTKCLAALMLVFWTVACIASPGTSQTAQSQKTVSQSGLAHPQKPVPQTLVAVNQPSPSSRAKTTQKNNSKGSTKAPVKNTVYRPNREEEESSLVQVNTAENGKSFEFIFRIPIAKRWLGEVSCELVFDSTDRDKLDFLPNFKWKINNQK